MPELAGDLLTLISARAVPGITFGVAVGGLLWLLGLGRQRAAPVAALLLTATFVAAGWGLTLLVALQLTLVGIGGRLSAAGARPDATDILGLAGVTSLCAVGSLSGVALAYWLAAGCGAAVGAAATWTAEMFGKASGLEHDSPAARTIGIGATGLVAAIIGSGSLAIATLWLRVLGPGEPALAGVGSLFGVALARRAGRTRSGRLATAALVAGASTALLAALLP